MKIPLIKGDRAGDDVEYRDSLPVNAITVFKPVFDVAGYMTTHPGLALHANAAGKDRGGVYNERQRKHFRVSGGSLIDANRDPIGLISGTDQASMPYSFNTQCVIADGKMWLYNGVDLEQVTDPDLGTPIDGCWSNGRYFLTDGLFLYHTDLDDESSIDPIKFATSEFSPDPTIGVAKSQDNQVLAFNRYTTEFFYDAATPGFAYQRVDGKAVKAGIIGTHLKVEMDGQFYCLGSSKDQSPTMLIISPGQYKTFSTREIDNILSTYAEDELSTGRMDVRLDEMNKFIHVYLSRHTLIYNRTIAENVGPDYAWSVLTSDPLTGAPWSGINGVYDISTSRWVYGDREEPRLGYLTDDPSQYGLPMESVFTSPFVKLENQSIDRMEIDILPGHSADDVNVFMSLSYDGIRYGREVAIRYSGDYTHRFIARRLGYIRHWFAIRFRVVSTDKISFANLVIEHG